MKFPSIVTLTDTGERRYPKAGESYLWSGSPEAPGIIDGPHYCSDDDAEWYGKPEQFAIYQVSWGEGQ